MSSVRPRFDPMKKSALLSGLLLALPLAAVAEPSASIVLTGLEYKRDPGGTRTVMTGKASAMIKEGTLQTTITANEITCVGSNRLECAGNVTITSAGRTLTATEITLTFADSPNVYVLNPAGIVVPPDGTVSPSTGRPTAAPAHLSGAAPFALPQVTGRP